MKTKTPKREIKGFSDLKKLIEGFKSEDQSKPIVIIQKDDHNRDIPVSIPSSNNSIFKKLLVDGFDMLQEQNKFSKSLKFDSDNEDFGGFLPAVVPEDNIDGLWIDKFISHNLDGKRVGLKVRWTLPEGEFELDPWSLSLTKI